MMQVVLRLYENAKINYLNYNIAQRKFCHKATPLWVGAYEKRIDQSGQLEWSQFQLRYLELILVTLFSITPNETKQVKV